VRHAPHEDKLKRSLRELAELQEKLGRHAGAIRSLRQMIALDPTSSSVKSWKRRIARCRQAIDAEQRTRTVRERLEESDLPLPTLAVEWMKAAGCDVSTASTSHLLAQHPDEGPLTVVLMPEPHVTGMGLRAAMESTRRDRRTRHVLVVTAAETLEPEARLQAAALQDERDLSLILAGEVRDALLLGNLECRRLLERVLLRTGQRDPFDYTDIVREQTEFFGRSTVINGIVDKLRQGQQVGLYGIHKIGKSSLLERLRQHLNIGHPEITVIRTLLNGQESGPADFYDKVLQALPGQTDLPDRNVLDTSRFCRELRDFHERRSRRRLNHRVLLLIDEYPFLIPDNRGSGGISGFAEILGTLKTLNAEGWLQVLPCGRSAALNRTASWDRIENPFIGLLSPLFLTPLTREENDELMKTLGRRVGLGFTSQALDEVYAATAGHPMFSRSLGSRILTDRDRERGEADTEDVRRAVESLLRDADRIAIVRAVYEDRMDDDEQEIAMKLATSGPLPYRSFFPESAKPQRRREIRAAIENLVDTTVLIRTGDDQLDHRYGLLRQVICQQAEELGYV
jgi:hypothetical protein